MATSLVQLANGSADTTQANPPDKEKARLELNLTGLCLSYAIQRSFLLVEVVDRDPLILLQPVVQLKGLIPRAVV